MSDPRACLASDTVESSASALAPSSLALRSQEYETTRVLSEKEMSPAT